MAAALPTGQGAASTLASLFDNPLVRQALLSQGLGATGNQQVTAPSGASLPRGAINGLLMQLLANASEGLAEADEVSAAFAARGMEETERRECVEWSALQLEAR